MKAKSVMRLTALLTGLALLFGAVAVFSALRIHGINKRYAIMLAEGMTAAQAGDHGRAVALLGTYLQRHPKDPRALTQYVRSRPLVEAPGNTELADTIVQLRRLLRLDPTTRIPELRQLLELYLRCGYYTEAATTAGQLLLTPGLENDPEILRGKFSAESSLHNYDAADMAVRRWVAASPNDIDPPMMRAWLQIQQHKPSSEILADAASWNHQSPGDPRRLIILGAVQLLVREQEANPQDRDKDTDEAIASLKEAAKALPDDAHVLDVLVDQLNVAGQFGESLALLERAAAAGKIPAAKDQLARRYWEAGRAADVVKLLDSINATDNGSPAELLGLKALAMNQLGQKPEASRIGAALASRQNDAVSKAWSMVLSEAIDGQQQERQGFVDACTAAIARGTGHGYLYFFMAQKMLYRDAADADIQRAVNYLQVASNRTRTWAVPKAVLASMLLTAGQYDGAWQAAHDAYIRAADSKGARVGFATVWFSCLQEGRTDWEPLLKLVTDIQAEAPFEEQSFLMELSLLASKKGIEPAQKELRRALDSSTVFSESALMQMVVVSEQYSLGLTSECLARDEHDHGVTASLAFARAVLEQSNPSGLATYEALQARAANPQSIEWQLNWARYLDRIGDPRAHATFVALASDKAAAQDARVQQFAMNARSAQGDRPFMDATLRRVNKLLGDRDIGYRNAYGRFWLMFKPTSDIEQKQEDQAVTWLLEVAKGNGRLLEPHVILGALFVREGKLLQAVEQYQIAANLRPDAPQLQLMLASALISHGESDKAVDPLKNYIHASKTNPSQSRLAAAMLASEGERKEAIDGLLASLRQSPDDSGATNLLLAGLYVSDGQPDKALAMCDDLLKNPTAQSIQFVTNLLASQGQAARAASILDSLEQVKQLEPGQREVIRAEYATKFGDPKQALGFYKMAVTNAPTQPFVWRSYINFSLMMSSTDEALKVIDDAHKTLKVVDVAHLAPKADAAVIGDINAIWEAKKDLQTVAANPSFKPIALSFVAQPAKGAAPEELLSLVAADLRVNKPPAAFGNDLFELAMRNQHFLLGQILAVQMLATAAQADAVVKDRIDKYNHAISVADTATRFFTNAPEPAMLLASVCRQCGLLHSIVAHAQKPENAAIELSLANELLQRALAAAQKWHERAPKDRAATDGMIALLQFDLGNSPQAIALLQPHLSETKSPEFGSIASLYGMIQVRAGHPELASAAMQPLLEQGEEGRRQWIQFATQNIATNEEAGWLERVTPVVASDSETQQVFLAEAWNDLFMRTGEQTYAEKGRALIAPLASKPDPFPAALFAMGTSEEMANHLEAAEAWYSKLITAAETGRLPQSDMLYRLTQNNLAMVLAKRGADLDRAQKMASEAVKAVPGAPAFHDTLSFVQARRGAYKEALIESQVAITLQPMEAGLRINRMQILLDDKQLTELINKLKELDGLKLDLNHLSLEKKRQLEALRGATKGGQA